MLVSVFSGPPEQALGLDENPPDRIKVRQVWRNEPEVGFAGVDCVADSGLMASGLSMTTMSPGLKGVRNGARHGAGREPC